MDDLLRGTLTGAFFGFFLGAIFVLRGEDGWFALGASAFGVIAIGVAQYFWQRNHPKQVA